jgi:hypothetical protein
VPPGNSFPWLYADRSQSCRGPGQALSVRRGKAAMCAEGGSKTSKVLPLLPASPTLVGYVGEEGGSDPMGFDAMGLSVKCDKFLPRFREAEPKHGRICMMA